MAPDIPFDRGARYGAAVVGMLFATYLSVATDFSAIVQSETYAGTIRNDTPIVNIVQFLIIVAAMCTSLILLPTSGMRRLGGVTVVCVSMFLWATLGLERGAGQIVQPAALWDFVLNQGFVTLLAAVGGWVIARGRHPLTWVVVLVALVPPIVARLLIDANFSTGGFALTMQALVLVGGMFAVWAAARIDRAIGRRAAGKAADAAPAPPAEPAVDGPAAQESSPSTSR